MSTQDAFSASSGTPDRQADEAKQAADALWQFVTSVKSVRKRDGRTEDFQLEKLERSLNASFKSLAKTEDEFLVRSLTELVYEQLQKEFDGVLVPTSDQVRDILVAILHEHRLPDVAASYLEHRHTEPKIKPPAHKNEEPVQPAAFIPTPMPSPSLSIGISEEVYVPRRRRLNEERKAITHKFNVGGHEGYITIGLYDDGQPGEIFLKMSKEGTMMSGLIDSLATAVSIGLQYGVPLKVLVNKFAGVKYEPNGPTQNPNIPVARSIVDYIFRYLALKFLTPQERQTIGIHAGEDHLVTDQSQDVLNVDGLRQSKLLDNEPNG